MYVWNTTLVFLGQKGFDFVVLRRPDASLVRKFRNFPPLRVGGGLLRTTFGLSCGPTVAEHDNNEALCDRYSSSHQLELVLYINVPIGAVGLLAGGSLERPHRERNRACREGNGGQLCSVISLLHFVQEGVEDPRQLP
jgi:hypothetical protein